MSINIPNLKRNTDEIEAIRAEVNRLNIESRSIRVSQPNQAYEFSKQAGLLALSIDYKNGFANSLINEGFYIFYIIGNLPEAYKKLMAAKEIFTALNNIEGLTWVSVMEGSLFSQQGEYEKAFAAFRNVLDAIQKNEFNSKLNKESELFATYLLGNLYLDLKDYTNSLPLHLKSLEIAEELQDIMSIGNSLISLANTYHAQGNNEKAITMLERVCKMAHEHNQTNVEGRAYNELALVYETLGEYEKAIKLVSKSLELRENFGNKQGMITCYLTFGKLYAKVKNYDYAIEMLHKVISLAVPLNTKPKIMRAYQDLAIIYKELEKPWQALESYEKYMDFKAEVMGEETSSQLRNAAAIHDADKARKEAEIEKLRNVELKEAYELIENKNQHIIDSIKYAKRIQEAILDPIDVITEQLGNAFIFYSAKDIVSGDFYWYGEVEHEDEPDKIYKIIIAADCTGHGVPGAFMTVMGNDFLNDIIITQQIINPSAILHRLDAKVTMTLQKQGRENNRTNDGMDISVLVIDEQEKKAYFAGAKHPLYLVRNNEIHEIRGSKFPIGSNQYVATKEFDMHSYDITKGDIFYLSSDGYQDQFGDYEKGKFMKRKFREFLLTISNLPMNEQHDILQKTILEWKGGKTQTDDWLVLGVKF